MKGKNVTAVSGGRLVLLFVVVSEVFLAIRFVLHFFAVNPTNGFASWIFNSTSGLVSPFRGTFTQTVTGHPHYVDLTLLFIMAGYAVFAGFMIWALKHFGDALANGKK